MFFNKFKLYNILILQFALFSACSILPEKDLGSLHSEEVFALSNLPCENVAGGNYWNRHEYNFICNMGRSVNYFLYSDDNGNVYKSKLLWKEYKSKFFASDIATVKLVLGILSDKFAVNDKKTMQSLVNTLNDYTFYTKYLKIKHETEYYKNVIEPYFLHTITLERR